MEESRLLGQTRDVPYGSYGSRVHEYTCIVLLSPDGIAAYIVGG